jgi:hypothetical protein
VLRVSRGLAGIVRRAGRRGIAATLLLARRPPRDQQAETRQKCPPSHLTHRCHGRTTVVALPDVVERFPIERYERLIAASPAQWASVMHCWTGDRGLTAHFFGVPNDAEVDHLLVYRLTNPDTAVSRAEPAD